MKSKALKLTMIISIIASVFFIVHTTMYAETYGSYTYTENNGKVTITDFDETVSGAIQIPSMIEGCPVTEIASSAFTKCTSITSVIIPDSVHSIGLSAFSNFTSLESITLTNNQNPWTFCLL